MYIELKKKNNNVIHRTQRLKRKPKKAKKYRAELNKYNRQKGTYGNGDGKDASHKGGKIVGFEAQSNPFGQRPSERGFQIRGSSLTAEKRKRML